MTKMKKTLSALCAVLMLVALLPVLVPVESSHAVTRQELQQQLSEAEQKAKDYKEQIEAVRKDKDKALQTKMLLDQRNAVLQQQIDTLQQQIDYTAQTIVEYESAEEKQYELFCRQVRQEEERGSVSYWSVLFKATGFADLLSRIDFINEVMDYNQRVINDLRNVRSQLAESRREMETQKTVMDQKQEELEEDIAEAQRVINEYVATEKGLQEMHDAEEAEAERITEELKNYYEQNGGAGGGVDDSSTQAVLDGLIWPSNARYITDKFGYRDSPTAGASTDHKGVDIGAPYYSDVFAAQSGTVIQAGWNGGYGYCVTIAHPQGVATLYAHLDDYFVSVGQSVSRGQVIAECGSTGISTGPHIHYEVRVNGVQIDPLPYLPGYIAWW